MTASRFLNYVRWVIGLAVSALMVSCAGHSQPFTQPSPGHVTIGRPFTFDAREPWHHTGFTLVKGKRYCLTATATDYNDSGQLCTPEGPIGLRGKLFDAIARDARCPLNPIHWFGPGAVKHLRVGKDRQGNRASFLTLVAAIGTDDRQENVQVVGNGCCFEAFATGELVLFANDWPGLPRAPQGPCDYYKPGTNEVVSKTYLNNQGHLHVTITPAKESR